MRHVEGEGGGAQWQPVRQEGDHEIGGHARDEAVNGARAKVEQAERQPGHNEVDVVLQL